MAEQVLPRSPLPARLVCGEHDWIRPSPDGMEEAMSSLTAGIAPGVDHEGTVASFVFQDQIAAFLWSVEAARPCPSGVADAEVDRRR
ncbi:MAG TPA: hypothetical protein VLA43_12255 [Longimicrobiales bacterium]|nr:hypothetical protein [Longimicrobiales bacterium]